MNHQKFMIASLGLSLGVAGAILVLLTLQTKQSSNSEQPSIQQTPASWKKYLEG